MNGFLVFSWTGWYCLIMGPLTFEPLWATIPMELGVFPLGFYPVPWLLVIAVGSFFMELMPVLFLLFNKFMQDWVLSPRAGMPRGVECCCWGLVRAKGLLELRWFCGSFCGRIALRRVGLFGQMLPLRSWLSKSECLKQPEFLTSKQVYDVGVADFLILTSIKVCLGTNDDLLLFGVKL